MRDEERKYHPSFGVIVLSKPSAGPSGVSLFGSKIRHSDFISLEIKEASISEDGFGEFIYSGDTVVKVDLSEAQWSRVVSSFGQGSGTPVTIHFREGHGLIENVPEPVPVIELARHTAVKTKNDLVGRLKDLERDVKAISESKTAIKKKDLAKLAMDFNILASWLHSNFEFLEKQVVDRMEREVSDAQIEIEALMTNTVARLGRLALAEKVDAGQPITTLLLGDQNA